MSGVQPIWTLPTPLYVAAAAEKSDGDCRRSVLVTPFPNDRAGDEIVGSSLRPFRLADSLALPQIVGLESTPLKDASSETVSLIYQKHKTSLRSNPRLRDAVFVFLVESNYGYTHAAAAFHACKEPADSPFRSIFVSSGNDPERRPGIRILHEDKVRFTGMIAYFVRNNLFRVWGQSLVCESGDKIKVMELLESELLAYRRVEKELTDQVFGKETFKLTGKSSGRKDDLVSALGLMYWAVKCLGDREWVSQIGGQEPITLRGSQYVKALWDQLARIPDFMYEEEDGAPSERRG